MKFFNPKEDVLEVVLTAFGRNLMARGRFNPEYYAFFDEDIIYDSAWASCPGRAQNTIEPRIQERTPYTGPPTTPVGIETRVATKNALIRANITDEYGIGITGSSFVVQDTYLHSIYNDPLLQQQPDEFGFEWKPLGTSELSSHKFPAWSVSALKGEISSSQHTLVEEKKGGVAHKQIPQLNIDVSYPVYVDKLPSGAGQALYASTASVAFSGDSFLMPDNVPLGVTTDQLDYIEAVQHISSILFDDGTFFNLVDGRIILEVEEKNTLYKKENFDVQVFHSSSLGLEALYFASDDSTSLGTKNVGKYLSMAFDREIEHSTLKNLGYVDLQELRTDSTIASVVSTKEFLVRDLYKPSPEECE
jgi:hypothetical protein